MLNLYKNIFYSEKVSKLYTDDALVNYMLQIEACLAQSQASHGVIPHSSAGLIAECCKAEKINKGQLMLQNIEITRGLVYAENVSMALAHKIGREDAHEFVEKCSKEAQAKNVHLKVIIQSQVLIKEYLEPDEIDELFNPISSVGLASKFIKRVLDSNK